MSGSGSLNVNKELAEGLTIHKNVSTNAILTTEDKIKLVLIEEQKNLTSKNGRHTPLGIILSLIISLITSDFKDTYGIDKNILKGIIIAITIGSGIWLIYEIYKAIKSKKNSIDVIIQKMKIRND